ncbi:MAG: four helix bundle protein [Oscillospiraceae bacterium]|nr:four helix bundle protein [Oscillospiraceae bacterium]
MNEKKSDLLIVTKAKDLCSYIMIITQKSPKQFRFTFVSRLQNLSLDIIECIFRANDIFIGKGFEKNAEKRLEFQHKALTSLKILAYISEISMAQMCILPKQYEQISKLTTDCQRLLGAWINSDKKRFSS